MKRAPRSAGRPDLDQTVPRWARLAKEGGSRKVGFAGREP